MTLKLVVWDMDGTLVDSRAGIEAAMGRAFTTHGLPPPHYDEIRHTVGLSLIDVFRALAPEDYSQTGLEALADTYRQAFVAQRADPEFREPLYEGALATMQRLADAGWLQAMATGKGRTGISAAFRSHPIERYFDSIHCADDGPGKPHPFMLEQAMGRLGAETTECVMIGDAVFDMQMGRSAGVYSLGVSWGFGTADELSEAGAHDVHHNFDSLNRALDKFGNGLMACRDVP